MPKEKQKAKGHQKQAGPVKKKTPRSRKPQEMTLEEWQIALRRDFGREQDFRLKNLGGDPIFSEFAVSNPQTKRTYRVAIRGQRPGENFCSCPDFATNTLGTCKHIEFTLAKLERKRGVEAALKKGFQPAYSELFLRYGAKREVVFYPGEDCPSPLLEIAGLHFDKNGVLRPDAYDRFDTFLHEARKATNGHELRCYDDALDFVAQVRDKARLENLVRKAFPQGASSAAFKNLLKVPLYPYQKEGALFAAKAGCCLIADDMGLGKTIQAIAAAEILSREAGIERVLVVCPTSLKHQWDQEIRKFTDRTAEVVEGLIPERTRRYTTDSFYKITNYDVIHRDLDRIRGWSPDLVVLDEAQRIKNWKTRTAQSVKKLESPYAMVLTGTPLENRLEELHSIVEFVDRYRLGPLFRLLHDHQHVDECGKVVGYRDLSKIGETLKPILIRRTKDEVLHDLPERLDKTFFVPMTKQQMEHHEENRDVVARIVAKWRRYGFLTEAEQRILMCALQNMRMSCNSTYLLDHETDHGVKADELVELLAEVFERPDTKAVVFSQWTRTHELLINRFESRNWKHVFFHGGVPGKKRKDLIDRFKEDPENRVFLSTDAGGVGLNLQNANVVVIMDQPWNPAVLEQRIGRVHRLGQHQPVRVVHFVAQGTIEHGMLDVLSFKKSMFEGVLDGGQNEVFLGGSRLKKFMESVEKVSNAIPEAMPRQASTNGKEAEVEAEPDTAPPREEEREEEPSVVAVEKQPWEELLSAGLDFVNKLGKTLNVQASSGEGSPRSARSPLAVTEDEETGQPCLKIPIPEPEMLQNLAEMLGRFAKALAGK